MKSLIDDAVSGVAGVVDETVDMASTMADHSTELVAGAVGVALDPFEAEGRFSLKRLVTLVLVALAIAGIIQAIRARRESDQNEQPNFGSPVNASPTGPTAIAAA